MKVSPNIKHVREQARACIFKFYPEMFLGEEIKDEKEKENAVELMKTFISTVISDVACPYLIHAIIHDKCHTVPELHKPKKPDKGANPMEIEKYNSDLLEYKKKVETFFWSPLLEKEHLHVLCITKTGNPTDIETIFNYFVSKGLKIRRDADTNGFLHGWVQKINMKQKRHICMMVYHTHETDEARAEGKYLYDRSEIYTNISANILESWYTEYFTCISKFSGNEEFDLCLKARELGRNVSGFTKSFDDFVLSDVPYTLRKKADFRQILRMEYNKGIQEFLQSDDSLKNIRCCIFINGKPNTGKTYTATETLKELNFNPYTVVSGKTGKFDNLTPAHRSIVVSDTSFGDILAMSDNMYCYAYRRGSGNPIFTGKFLIITYNGSFDKFLKTYYSKADWFDNPETVEAVKSRFYQAEIGKDGKLHFLSGSFRGSDYDISVRNSLAMNFKIVFNKLIENYVPVSDAKMKQCNDDFLKMCGDYVAPAPVVVPAVALAPAVASSAPAPCQETLDLLSLPAKSFIDDFTKLPF